MPETFGKSGDQTFFVMARDRIVGQFSFLGIDFRYNLDLRAMDRVSNFEKADRILNA
jgi:hypothetical protein